MADVAGFSMVAEAQALKLVAVVNMDNTTGYAGASSSSRMENVTSPLPRHQAQEPASCARPLRLRGYSAEEDGLARAYAMHVQDTLQEGESLPSPARRKYQVT